MLRCSMSESFKMSDEEIKKHNNYSGINKIFCDDQTLEKIEELAGMGFRMKDIADYYGVSISCLRDYRIRYPEINLRFRRGKVKAISLAATYLFAQMEAGSSASTIFYLKTQAGWVDKEPSELEDDDLSDGEDSKDDEIGTDPIEASKRYQQIMQRGKK